MGPSPKLVHTRRRHYALAHQKTSRTFGKCKTNTRRRRRRGRVNDQNSDLGNQNDKAKKKHTSQNLLQRERARLTQLLKSSNPNSGSGFSVCRRYEFVFFLQRSWEMYCDADIPADTKSTIIHISVRHSRESRVWVELERE